jgi:carbamoyltransferase
MLILGLKLTHDGGLAAIENGHLLFCIEAEKVNNSERYRSLRDLASLEQMLR